MLNGLFTKKSACEYLVVGLGNPTPKYENTRHNVGFVAIDAIAKEMDIKADIYKFKAMTGKGEIHGKKCMIMKPMTYMNLSGEAVSAAMRFYKIPVENLIVIFDDISLDVGKLRIRRKGSDGGHNGIKSIIEHTGSTNFPRIKIGVGQKPHPDYDLANWVLSKFSTKEKPLIAGAVKFSTEAIEYLVNDKIDKAMALYNK